MAINKTVKTNVILSKKQHTLAKTKYAKYGCDSLCHLVRVAIDFYADFYEPRNCDIEKLINDNKIPKNFPGKAKKK